jgi:hypothetical protein
VPVVVAQVATSAWEMTGDEFAWRMEVPGVGVGRSAVSPRVGAPRITLVRNTEVVVSGFGFKAGTDVEIWLFSDPVYLGSILVGSDGTFRGGVPVPAAMMVGEHTLQANGESFDGQRRSLSLGVQVVDPVVVELPVTGSDRMPVVWALLILLSGAFLWSRSRGGRLDEFDC